MPSLAAQIDAVRSAVEYARISAFATGSTELWDKYMQGLRAALRTLEALADQDTRGFAAWCTPGTNIADAWEWWKNHSGSDFFHVLEGYRHRGDAFLAALLARAGGGG